MDNSRIIESFSRYCLKCEGKCCSGIMVGLFDWEFPRAKGHSLPPAHRCGVLNLEFKEDCIFLKDHRCSLPSEDRLLDCLSYPVYPRITDGKIDGLIVHKDCPYHKEIAGDKKLTGMIKKVWEENLEKLRPEQVDEFFSGEFWGGERIECIDK